jgi:D-glycero-D-manno-heptose 1,7-bisphosphate phosphatase
MPPETAIFLDRDGVLNRRIPGGYVTNYQEWEWLPGARAACAELSQYFDRVLIVTNQQGIGKGLMTENDLHAIHQQVVEDIEASGGRIDGIYFCPHLKTDNCSCRKPRPGLIRQALNDFPAIALTDAYLAGDSYSDLLLANRVRLQAVWVDTKAEEREHILAHLRLKTLRIKHRVDSLRTFTDLIATATRKKNPSP